MRLLLINKNPVVSRMMQMSVPKAGFDIEECDSIYDLPTGKYEVVVLDDEMYDENFLHDIQQNIKYHQIGIITTSKSADFSNFDFVLTKPFLPTDLIEILRKVKSEIEHQREILPVNEPEEQPREEFFENFLNDEASPFEEEERIVEIEEPQEESPFIEEPLEKAGILKEEEVEEVSELLKESTLDEEPLAVTEEPTPFQESEPEEEQITSFFQEENLKPSSPHELGEPQAFEEAQEKSAPQTLGALTPEDLLTEVEEKIIEEEPQKKTFQEPEEKLPDEAQEQETSLQDLKNELQKLDVKGLREILDGMQLEITIKISYPDRKDV